MKRNLKNIVMMGLLVAMLGAILFTINYTKNNSTTMPNGDLPSDVFNNDDNFGMREPPSNGNNDSGQFERPEMPDGESGNMPSDGMPDDMQPSMSTDLNTVYYIVLGIEAFVIASVLIYLLMSKFNSKTYKETFANKEKIIVAILAIVLVTTGITYISGKTASNGLMNGFDMNQSSDDDSYIIYSRSKESTIDETYSSIAFV